MSFIVNPTSLRLAYSVYWNNSWSLSSLKNYSFLNFIDYDLVLYIYTLFSKYRFKVQSFFISNIKLFKIFNKLYIYIYIKLQTFRITEYYKKYIKKLKYKYTKIKINHNKKNNNKIKKLIGYYIKYQKSEFKFIIKRKEYFNLLKQIYILYWYNNKIKWNLFFKYKLILNIYFFYIYKKWLNILHKIIYKSTNLVLKNRIYIIIKYIILTIEQISAKYIGDYIKHKLVQKYPIKKIIFPLLKNIETGISKKIFKGVKISFSGRASRRDRKIYLWKSKGYLNYTNTGTSIDYHLTTIKLLNSLCGIKVWINKMRVQVNYFII